MTTVLICDDHRRVREHLRRSVAAVPGVDRVDTAACGEEALARYAEDPAALVLMAVGMAGLDGLETTRRLVASDPQANVVMITDGDDDESAVEDALNGGARGFLTKDVSREELCATVANALTGQPVPTEIPVLTEREHQVLNGMSRGKSNGEIGRELYLSEDTIKTHARRLFRKLGVNDRAQAVALGFRLGLVR